MIAPRNSAGKTMAEQEEQRDRSNKADFETHILDRSINRFFDSGLRSDSSFRAAELVTTRSVECTNAVDSQIKNPVSRIVKRSFCRSIVLRQEELAFIKSISTLRLFPALPKKLRMALSRRKKKSVVPPGSRGTTPGGGSIASQRPSRQLGDKRKVNELASSGDSFEPANSRVAPGAGSAALPETSLEVTGGTSCCW